LRQGRFSLIETTGSEGYALLDSGHGRKLERFGEVVVDRPERQALWRPALGREAWDKAHAVYSASDEDEEKGRWRIDRPVPDSWAIATHGIALKLRLQGLWHLGVFPEQAAHWTFMTEQLARLADRDEPPRMLNLFGYTGAASLIAARCGAAVTHVDASKKAIAWGRENQAASGLEDRPIRWIVDDAAKFTAREVRRGRSYDVILVDPPKFGRGPKNEVWDLFQSLPSLLGDCARLLSGADSSLVLTVYAIRASAVAFEQVVAEAIHDAGSLPQGVCETGELLLRARNQDDGEDVRPAFCVPTSLFVRWSGGEGAR